jgi:hypothetical protein
MKNKSRRLARFFKSIARRGMPPLPSLLYRIPLWVMVMDNRALIAENGSRIESLDTQNTAPLYEPQPRAHLASAVLMFSLEYAGPRGFDVVKQQCMASHSTSTVLDFRFVVNPAVNTAGTASELSVGLLTVTVVPAVKKSVNAQLVANIPMYCALMLPFLDEAQASGLKRVHAGV